MVKSEKFTVLVNFSITVTFLSVWQKHKKEKAMIKKSVKNLVKDFFCVWGALSAVFLFGSCNIGLGESVDTEAPVVKVTYPSNSSTVRGNMVLYGICDDDKGISSITVSVKDNAAEEYIDFSENAQINGNTWQLEIDTTALTDGNYTFTATAKDGAGHTAESSGTYDIDNHAPLFVATKPGVIKSGGLSPSAYGSTFTVEGTIADEHSIEKMVLSVYKEDGTLAGVYEESDIATAGGTSVTFANANKGQDDVYYKIYDSSNSETQNFYCTVTLYDSAYEYNDPAGTNGNTEKTGNSTSALYLYDDIYTDLMSSSSGGLGLTAADLMNVLNGTSNKDADIQNSVKQILENQVKNTALEESCLYFSLNPNANPTYTVNGYDFDISTDAASDIHQLSGGGTISVSYNYGLNETLVQPYGDSEKRLPSLKVWIRKLSATSALPSVAEALNYLEDLETSVKALESSSTVFTEKETAAGENEDWILIYDYAQNNERSSSSSTGTFAVTIPSGIVESGSYYLFGVTGSDIDKMYFAQKSTFIFQGTTAGFAPAVKISSPSVDSAYTNEAGMSFTGSAVLSTDDLYVNEISAVFTYGLSGGTASKFTLKYLIEKENDESYSIKKVLKETEEGYETEALSGTEALTYYIQNVYKTDEYGNQTEELLHSAGDFIFDVSKIEGYSVLEKALSSSGSEYIYTLTVTAASSSSHTASAVRSTYIDTVAPVFDDESSSVGGICTKAGVLNAWFGSESLSVKGSLTENGSGVSQVDYWLDKAVSEESSGTFVPSSGSDGNYIFKGAVSGFTESTEELPYHFLRFVGIDKAGNKSAVQEYCVKVDVTYPEITPKFYTMGDSISGNASGNVLTNKENDVVIYGLVSDTASGLSAVEIANAEVTYSTEPLTKTETAEDGTQTEVPVTTDLSWFKSASYSNYDSSSSIKYTAYRAVISKDKIAVGDVKYSVCDTAANKNSNRIFSFTVDTEKPSVSYKELTDADSETDGTQVNGNITVSGTADDNNQMNKITEIQYKLEGSESWTTLGDALSSSSSAYSWSSVSIDTSSLFAQSKEKAVPVYFRAIALDSAGNYSDENESGLKLIIDQNTDRPVINVTSIDKGGDIISAQTIRGTVTDDDGIKAFEYSQDNGTSWNEITVSSGSWAIESLEAGTHSILFRVTDKEGSVFTTGSNDTGTFSSCARPYLSYSDGKKTDNTAALSFSVDLNPPEIKELKLAAAAENSIIDEASSSWTNTTVNFGKESRYLNILLKVNEDVAVHSSAKDDVSVKIGTATLDFTADSFKNVIFSRSPEDSVNGDLTYIIGPIDVSALNAEGTQTASVTVKDNSGRESSQTQNIYIDESAPEVSVTSPAADDAVTGSYTIKGRIDDTSGIAGFKYMIPSNAQIKAGVTKDTEGWISVESDSGSKIEEYETALTSSNYQIKFTSSSFKNSDGTSLIYYAAARDSDSSLTYAAEKEGSETGEVYVPLYFYSEDSTGNGAVTENRILVNPRGGIPSVEITSHTDLSKTGNTVTLLGSASDDEKIASVNITSVEYTSDDTVTDDSSWTKIENFDTGVVVKGTVDESDPSVITAEGTTSWKASINAAKIKSSGAVKALRFTVESFDENGTSSAEEYPSGTAENCSVRIYVDAGNPELKSASIVGFNTVPSAVDASADWEKSYSAGMYFSKNAVSENGKWFLKAVVTDDSSVKDVSLSSQTGGDYISAMTDFDSSEDAGASGVITGGTGTKEYTVLIPVNVETEGKVYATLTMNDEQHTDVTASFSFNIDNTAPSIYDVEGKEFTSSTELSSLRLKALGKTIDETNVVENSDGSFTFGDSLKESGSGLGYVAFYFKKPANDKNGTNRVYSPMFNENGSNKVELSSSKTDGSVYINEEGLPALYKAAVTREDETKLSFSDLGENFNINSTKWCGNASSFGLVKIGGSYHKISAIDGNTATLEDSVPVSHTEAEFIYAMLIDHEITEGFDSSSDTGVSNDDGDGLVEMVKRSGTTYTYSASIYSENIPDGPAEIHIVAFDEAGNSSHGYVKTSVQNNRPRISRVYLATDLNGNGSFDYYNENSAAGILSLDENKATANGTEFGELVFYSALDTEGKVQGNAVLSSNVCNFTASGDMLVLPEIVGGNGELKYALSVAESGAAASSVGLTSADENALLPLYASADDLNLKDKEGTAGTVQELLQDNISVDKNHTLTENEGTSRGAYKGLVISKKDLEKYESWTGDSKLYRYFAFTFWDSTEETTQGKDSLYALLKVPVIVNVIDDVKPEAKIKPFYWNSKDDSSFVYDDDGTAQGHISIKEVPGVSGKIYIDGTAEDETRLSELYVKEPDGAEYLIAGYENGEWVIPSSFTPTAETASNAKWTIESCSVETVTEPSQSGHKVNFRIEVNVTPYGVAEGKVIEVYALDDSSSPAGKNKSELSTEQTVKKSMTPYYKVDFVPYIKSIYPSDASEANRSRLGKFPVNAGKYMTIEGMNFALNASYKVNFYKSGTEAGTVGGLVDSETVTGTVSQDGFITVKAPDYSRWVEVEVDGVKTPNNDVTDVSEISGCDIEEGYSAAAADKGVSSADKNGTNFWTSNRYISAWNTGTSFEGSINPHSGVVKKISKKNSGSATDGQTSNDFVGKGSFYNNNGTNSSLRMSTNQNDRYFGAISSDDLKIYGYLSTVTYSSHGDNVSTNKSEAMFQAPGVDQLDYTLVNGMPYYVMQDNFVGGDSASVFGPGLFITREGMNFDMALFQKGNTIEEKDTFAIIERQGSSGAAANRNSSTGYDSVMYQFKNPRIAGTHVSSETLTYSTANGGQTVNGVDYIYVSYYDSYAHCLKYAGYKIGHRINKDNQISLYKWGNTAEYCDIVPMAHSALNSSNNYNDVKESNHMTDGGTTVAGYDTTITNPKSFKEKAGEWSDIMVDSTGNTPVPVIIYYNETKKCLEIARGTVSFPVNNRITTSSGTTGSDEQWVKSTVKPSKTGDFGRYVSAAMDEAGNIHACAVDSGKGKVYYLYIVKSGNTYSLESYSVIGTVNACWTDIELSNGEISTENGTTGSITKTKDVRPVISWVNKAELNAVDGACVSYLSEDDSDGTKWETVTDPAVYAVYDQRTSVMSDIYEGNSSKKAKLAVGFNSSMYAVDFLRGEE